MAGNTETALATLEERSPAFPVPVISFEEAKRRFHQPREFMREILEEGTDGGGDYGIVPGTGAKKPSLFKPGAEKFCLVYGLAPDFELVGEDAIFDDPHYERAAGRPYFAFRYKCSLRDKRTGGLVASCVGECNTNETRFQKRDGTWMDPWAHRNPAAKMAQKRAYVGATLLGCAASGIFTMDVEDFAGNDDWREPETRRQHPAKKVALTEAGEERACPSCDQPMVLRSGTTRDGRPYSAWFCSAKCGQKPIWLSERKTDAPPPATPKRTVQAEIVAPVVPASTADRLLSAAETRKLRDDVMATFRNAGWKDDETRAAVARRLAELGVSGVEQLKLHASQEFRRWAEEAAAGAASPPVPEAAPAPADEDADAMAHFAEL
jgi:hypothetical protein